MNYPQSRIRALLIALTVFLLTLVAQQTTPAKDTWTSVRSQNFLLVGNAGEKEIRQVANRLEQFRTVFALLFPSMKFTSPVPTTVVVFKSDSSYKPFKVNPNASGYFQAGEDINYITLTTERASEDKPFRVIFHEYVHLLIDNTLGESVPLWFNEGLAEYYSTFDVTDENRKVILGELVSNHVLYLRENKLLPLRTLFAVDYKSPYYNEGNKMNIFYAESWMLMHYLLQGDAQKRRPQLARFVDLLRANVEIGSAFQQAFQTPIETFEKDFKAYIQSSKYVATAVSFEKKLEFDSQMQAAPLTEAEAQAYLGDLLLHTTRFNDAENYLQQALTLSPELSSAAASLGLLRVRQHRLGDAREYLARAVAGNSQNYLAHYYYALALSGLSIDEYKIVDTYPPDVAATMRSELKKTIALKPEFAESYGLLGFVNVVRNEELDETIELLKRALNLARGNHRIVFVLAQLYLRKGRFADARELLEPIANKSPDPNVRQRAQSLIDGAKRTEELIAAARESGNRRAFTGAETAETQTAEGATGPTPEQLNSDLQESLRAPQAGESRVQGMLTTIECNAKGITFVVRADGKLLRFHTDNFERMKITAFTPEVSGEITCGPRKTENTVVMTYAAAKAGSKVEGEANALEFVPRTFVLKQ